jgi:hypothetical protein
VKIEAYDFGAVTIDGVTYTADLKIIDGKVIPNWWRVEGHNLLVDDIGDILSERPDIVVVGTGHSGLMQVSDEVRQALVRAGIQLVAKPTGEACGIFNDLSASKRVAFAAHLTC